MPFCELYPGEKLLEMPGTPQKKNVGSWHENQGKPKLSFSHSFPSEPSRVLLVTSEGNMEEIGDKYARSGKCHRRTRLSDMTPGRNDSSRGIRDVWHPSKTKDGQLLHSN